MQTTTQGHEMEITFAVIINGTHVMAWFADGGHMMFRM